jgi:hypothetical protein
MMDIHLHMQVCELPASGEEDNQVLLRSSLLFRR